MGKDSRSWIHRQCPPHQGPNLNGANYVPDSVWPNAPPDSVNQLPLISTETFSGHIGRRLHQSQAGVANAPQGWFYGLSRYRQAFRPMPISSCTPKELNVYSERYPNGGVLLGAVSRSVERKFIVVDHSRNQTSLIFSPGIDYPNQYGNVAFDHCDHPTEEWEAKMEMGSLYDEKEMSAESEMHEDTEELNALLYSDEEVESECDCDEVSTGHSPIKRTGEVVVEENNTCADEVASSDIGPLRRKRSFVETECSASSSLMDSASSGKSNPNGSSAESVNGERPNKLLKRDKILETIDILQNIIPGGKDKNGMFVLDEAIQYLKSLKLKAEILGENTGQDCQAKH